MQRRSRPYLLIVMALTAFATLTLAEDWPHWRGPNHDGISSETGFVTKWETAPPKVWERDIGSAYSGLACVGGRVYTCGTVDKSQVLFCLAADTGKVFWRTAFEKEYRERHGSGTRATPTVTSTKAASTCTVPGAAWCASTQRAAGRYGGAISTTRRSGATAPLSSLKVTWPS